MVVLRIFYFCPKNCNENSPPFWLARIFQHGWWRLPTVAFEGNTSNDSTKSDREKLLTVVFYLSPPKSEITSQLPIWWIRTWTSDWWFRIFPLCILDWRWYNDTGFLSICYHMRCFTNCSMKIIDSMRTTEYDWDARLIHALRITIWKRLAFLRLETEASWLRCAYQNLGVAPNRSLWFVRGF